MNRAEQDVTAPAQAIPWPEGARSCVMLGFDLDAEAVALTTDPASGRRLSVMSHQSYGPLTGVPRILELLRRHDIRATFFCPGYTAERYPDLLRRVRDEGHEIAHHGYLHEDVTGMTATQEAAMIDRGLEALDAVLGHRPLGYRAPMWETTYRTVGMLLDRGFLYDSSLMDSDVPYELSEGADGSSRSIIEIPVSWALDDWEQYAYVPGLFGSGVIEDPAKVLSMWRAELDASHVFGTCFTLTCHPFLSGRPSRVRALEQLIISMKELPDLWIATGSEVARHTRSLARRPRHFPEPEV